MWIFFVLLILLIISLLIEKFNITPFLVVMTYGTLGRLYGYNACGYPNIFWFNYICTLLFMIGYMLIKNKGIKFSNGVVKVNKIKDVYSINNYTKVHIDSCILFIGVVVFFVIYNFAVGGIPILMQNVESERFNFTRAGLFGVPGRMVQYGIYFVLYFSLHVYLSNRDNRSKNLLKFTAIVFLVAKLLGGFKGSIISVIITVITCMYIAKVPFPIRKLFNWKIVILIILSLVYAFFMTRIYTMSEMYSGDKSFIENMLDRLTIVGAEAGCVAYNRFRGLEWMLVDISYFMRKYFGIKIGMASLFTLENYVSAYINSVPLTADSYIVPVTLGAYNEAFVFGGSAFAGIISVIIGLIYSKILNVLRFKNISSFCFASLGMGLYFLESYLSKGGLMYYTINYVLMVIMLFCIYFVTKNFKIRLGRK